MRTFQLIGTVFLILSCDAICLSPLKISDKKFSFKHWYCVLCLTIPIIEQYGIFKTFMRNENSNNLSNTVFSKLSCDNVCFLSSNSTLTEGLSYVACYFFRDSARNEGGNNSVNFFLLRRLHCCLIFCQQKAKML